MTETEKAVINIVADQAMIDRSALSPLTRLDTLPLDSVMMVEIIFALEENFNIHIPFNANTPEAKEFNLDTIGSIATAIDHLAAQPA